MSQAVKKILEEVAAIVMQRSENYGDPKDCFLAAAEKWTATLNCSESLTGREVAICMAQMKLTREARQHKRDNLIDAIGYLSIALSLTEGENNV